MKRRFTVLIALILAFVMCGCSPTAPPPDVEPPGGGVVDTVPGDDPSDDPSDPTDPPETEEPKVEVEDKTPEAEKAKVILLAGGDNCMGNSYSYHLNSKNNPSSNVTPQKYAEYTKGYDNVLIHYRNMLKPSVVNTYNRTFEPVRLGMGRAAVEGYEYGTFGPEVGLAEYFSNKYSAKTTYILKFGGGNHSTVSVEWNPDGGGYYSEMMSFFNSGISMLEEKGVSVEIPAILFVQGESDARYNWSGYSRELSALSEDMRDAFSDYAPSNGIAFIDAGVSSYYVNYDKLNAEKKSLSERDGRNYYLDVIKAGLSHDTDAMNRKFWSALSELKLGNLLGSLVQESFGYRLDGQSLKPTAAVRPEKPSEGYVLTACADGGYASSVWNFERTDSALVATAYVEDSLVTAGDGVSVVIAPAVRERRIPDGSLEVTVRADGTSSRRFSLSGEFFDSPSSLEHAVTVFDGGYTVRLEIPSSAAPDGDISVSFALINKNVNENTRSYRALGTKPDRTYTFMRFDRESKLIPGYAQPGETFGDGGILRASDVWDLSSDDGTPSATVVMTSTKGDNDLYFHRSDDTYLYAEAEIGTIAVRNGERWGKFGMKITTIDRSGIFFYVDAWGNGVDMFGYLLGYATFTNGAWNNDWTNFERSVLSGVGEYKNGNAVKLAVRRERDLYTFYCNDIEVAQLKDPANIGVQSAYMGLASFNIEMFAMGYSLRSGTDAAKDKLTVTAPDIYTNYPAKELTVRFADPADVEPVSYTVEGAYADKVFIEDGMIRAEGDFPSFVNVRVAATTSKLQTFFTVRVGSYNGTGPFGSLNMETRAKNFLATWQAKGAQKGGVLFVGDSFFDADKFWTDFYTSYYGRKNAYCFGVGSSKTTDWEIFSERVVFPLEPKAIVVHCGTNNIFDGGKDAATAAADIIRLLQLMLDRTNAQIYYFGIEPRIGANDAAGNARAITCNDALINFCDKQSRVKYLDSPAFCLDDEGNVDNSFFRDTVHPKLSEYARYADALDKAGLTFEPSAALSDTSIADVQGGASQPIVDTTRLILYRGMPLSDNYVLDGKIEITATGSNPHIQFAFDGTSVNNRYLIWDSNGNGVFGLCYAKGGVYTNEVQRDAEDFAFVYGKTLEIYFRLAVVKGTAYFYIGDGSGNYALEDSWAGVPATDGLRIGTEYIGARVCDMRAVTEIDDPEQFAEFVSSME